MQSKGSVEYLADRKRRKENATRRPVENRAVEQKQNRQGDADRENESDATNSR